MSGFSMDVASAATAMKAAETAMNARTALASKALDIMEDQGAEIAKLIDSARVSQNVANFSGVGQLVDIRA